MAIVKGVWRFLLGVKNFLVLIAMLLLFGMLGAIYFSGAPNVHIADGSALEIRLDGLLVDQAAENSPLALLSGEPVIPQTETAELVRAIDTAAKDPAIAMITLNLDRFLGGGLANLEAVGAALQRFRAEDKQVWVWATAYEDDGYLLASFADRIAMSPQGAVLLRGPGGSSLYFKNALDKLHVNVEVFRVGTYKSFVEPFTRSNASPEAKAASQQLADDIWVRWRAVVQKQRPALDIAALLASWPQRATAANRSQAQLAEDAGLIDTVVAETGWRAQLLQRLGAQDSKKSLPGDYKRVTLGDYWALRQPVREAGPGVALVHVAGSIIDGEAAAGAAGGDTIAGLIEQAIADKDVKALVVRIDSGGGSVLASEKIRLALWEARNRKLPVIASFGPVAASGGYWLATAADTIYASPATVTGSIGVFGIIPTFEDTLHSLGISTDAIRTTELSGQPDIFGGLNDPARGMIQSGVEDIYRDFLGHVAQARSMPVARVEAMAEGRVWSGVRAKKLNLIDAYGGLDAAIAEAGKRAGLKDQPRIIAMRPQQPFLMKMLQTVFGMHARQIPSDGLAANILANRLKIAAQLAEAARLAEGSATLQAACIECIAYHAIAPAARATSATSSWRALLSGLRPS